VDDNIVGVVVRRTSILQRWCVNAHLLAEDFVFEIGTRIFIFARYELPSFIL
jgi:hypothetical protein